MAGVYETMHIDDVTMSLSSHTPAWEKMVYFVNKYPGKISFLVTGPMTNIAKAIELDPEFANKIDRFVVMGGCVDGTGNVTKHCE
mmetsp:Transcript_56458/g.122877  ORF Transcript_56458/g.122877 Transcript_56458/m.122877 type:complete len:85 (+) Transcript_56458:292-546(+)